MSGVPYTFASATSSIPLSQLDANFATPVTIGTTTVGLGNTTTTLAGLSNVSTTVTNTSNVASNGSLLLQTNGTTTAVTIDTNQNVGIGTTSPANKLSISRSATDYSASILVNNSSSPAGSVSSTMYATENSSSGLIIGKHASGFTEANLAFINQETNAPLTFLTNGSERARIDSSGNLLVGTTSGSGGRVVSLPQSGFNTSGADNWKAGAFQGQGGFGGPVSLVNTLGGSDGYCFFLENNPSTLYIQYGANAGGLSNGVQMASTATSWGSASDERLKTTITPFPNALEKVCTLRAGTGRFLTDAENFSRSFLIAQDVQKVLPEAVDVGKDELQTLSLRYQDLIPLLTASIQELSAQVTTLQSQVAALQAKVGA